MDEFYGDMCRVCLCVKKDDFESIFIEGNHHVTELSDLGHMYEDLFNLETIPNKRHPQFLCGYCSLQMKFLYKLKCKAIESYNKFAIEVKSDEYNVTLLYTENENYGSHIKIETLDSYSPENSSEYNEEELMLDDVSSKKNYSNKLDDTASIDSDLKSDHDPNDEYEQYEYEIENDSSEEFEEIQYLEPEYQNLDAVKLEVAPYQSNYKSENGININGTYKCKNCDEEFKKKNHLILHRRQKHRRQKFPCSLCEKIFFSEESLTVHLNVHNGLPAYQCELCDKTFNQKAHYIYHMLGHRNERKFACHLCEKKFLNKSDLGIHLRVHYDERRYECDVCHQKFRAYTHMTNHRYSHFEKRLECKYCRQKYTSPNTLKTHIKSVHLLECPFTCEVCNKKFKRKHHLKAHLKVHARKKMIEHVHLESSEFEVDDNSLVKASSA